nr:hypothetical protein [Oxalobacteraceae bacterium]
MTAHHLARFISVEANLHAVQVKRSGRSQNKITAVMRANLHAVQVKRSGRSQNKITSVIRANLHAVQVKRSGRSQMPSAPCYVRQSKCKMVLMGNCEA